LTLLYNKSVNNQLYLDDKHALLCDNRSIASLTVEYLLCSNIVTHTWQHILHSLQNHHKV